MSVPTPSPTPQNRVYDAEAAAADGYTWRPIQRSTRFIVFVALGVTVADRVAVGVAPPSPGMDIVPM